MTRLLLVRHGESEWNASGRWQGWADVPLTDLGRRQATHAADRLRPLGITVVAASDLERTLDTATIIARALQLEPVLREPGLREFNVGEWSGLTKPEIEQRWPGQIDAWRSGAIDQTPGGEARAAFESRIVRTLVALAAAHRRETVLAVTHGGFIGALQRLLHGDGSRDRIGNLTGRWVEIEGERVTLGGFERLLDADETTVPSSL